MASNCCVPGCNTDGAFLHKFPDPKTEQERFNNWYNAIGDGDLLKLDCEEIYKSCSICHSHFEKKYLVGTERITGAAVPTLYLPETKLLNEDSRCISCLCSYDQRRLHLYPIQTKALRLVFEETCLLVCNVCREQALQVDKFVTTVQNNQFYLAQAESEVSGSVKANPKPVERTNTKQNVYTQRKGPESVASRTPALNLHLGSDNETDESSDDALELEHTNRDNITTALEITTIKEEKDIDEVSDNSNTQTVTVNNKKTNARAKSEEAKRNKRKQTGDLDAEETKRGKNKQGNPIGFEHMLEIIQTTGDKSLSESLKNMKAASDSNNTVTIQVQMPNTSSDASAQDPELYDDYYNSSYECMAEPLIGEHEPSSSTAFKWGGTSCRANFADNNLMLKSKIEKFIELDTGVETERNFYTSGDSFKLRDKQDTIKTVDGSWNQHLIRQEKEQDEELRDSLMTVERAFDINKNKKQENYSKALLEGFIISDSSEGGDLRSSSNPHCWASDGVNSVKKKKKIRKSDKERRQDRAKRTLFRNSGLEYTTKTGKIKERRQLRELKNCRRKCKERLPQDLREKLFQQYWSLGSQEHRTKYIAKSIEVYRKKKSKASPKKKRNVNFSYFVYSFDHTKHPICKGCLLKTYDESERYLQTICEKLRDNGGHLPQRKRRVEKSIPDCKQEEI